MYYFSIFIGISSLFFCTVLQADLNKIFLPDIYQTEKEISKTSNIDQLQNSIDCLQLKNTLGESINLSSVIEQALCHNPETRQAWVSVKRQAAQVGLSQSEYLPKINGSYRRSKSSNDYINSSPELNDNTSMQSRNYTINASWLLFDFGSRKYKLVREKFLLQAAYANQNSALQKVFFETAKAYYEVIKAHSLLNTRLDSEKETKQNQLAAKARYNAGIGTLADQLQAQTNYAKAISDRIQAEGNFKISKGNLVTLMGLPLIESQNFQLLDTSETINSNVQFNESIENLLQQAAYTHPEIISALEQVQAAESAVKVANKEDFPTISVTSDFTKLQQTGAQILQTKTDTTTWGIAISFPLFDGFSRNYRIRSAQADLSLKRYELKQTEQIIALNVWKSYYNLLTATENLKAIEILQQSAEQSYKVALGRYNAGVGTMLELLNAQNANTAARQQKVDATTTWLVARLQLFSSIGKLEFNSLDI